MYAFPTRLPQISNREDLLIILMLADDDFEPDDPLAPINLAGITGSGTKSSWTVNVGGVLTSSLTTLTIPVYPIGDDLSSISLTIGTGLTINAGDPVTITDTGDSANTMMGYVLSYVAATGLLTCQIGLTCQFEVRSCGPGERVPLDGYAPYSDFGAADLGPLLTGSLGSYVYITDLGFLQIRIPEAQTRQVLGPGTYIAALTVTDSVDTRQVFIASLPVQYGAVTR